uniref:NAD(P)H-quinone oxidoreductase subunit K, chloroplastic n=1 Tax=Leiosporoceros dussii TaxID=263836 RepID=A0A385KDZ7_9EMBR|nr:27 kDa subunit of NADH-ubiquinone oxidoreductase [Leiosporoceros dussii]AXZ70895.1 27 kDa subunit of NADH-ubiquinone oxidoreductase [Leiosporoceros dussii]
MAKRSIRMVLVPKYLNSENEAGNLVESIINSIDSLPDQTTSDSIILTTFNDFSNWARLSSLWPLLYGTSCCFIEFASLIGSRFDFDRYGLVPRSSPRQADLIITAGTVTMKMAPSLVRLYEQMPEPKYVIAMGACTITGGMFSTDSYSTVRGVDKLIPVDIYLPGCPPKPEAIIDAIIKLRKKVAREVYEHQDKLKQTRRFFILNHRLKIVPITHTGKYDEQIFSKFSEFSIESDLDISSQIIEESKSSVSSQIIFKKF